MFDPISVGMAMSTASAAFGGLKKAFQAGRDIESMTQDLSRWMGAVSDIDNAAKDAQNPGMFKKVFGGGSIEQEAIEAFAAKKKLEEQRYELKQFLMFTHGHASWDELLRMEGQIRKRRQKEIYEKAKFRRQIFEWVAIALVIGGGTVILVLFVMGLMGLDRGWFG